MWLGRDRGRGRWKGGRNGNEGDKGKSEEGREEREGEGRELRGMEGKGRQGEEGALICAPQYLDQVYALDAG